MAEKQFSKLKYRLLSALILGHVRYDICKSFESWCPNATQPLCSSTYQRLHFQQCIMKHTTALCNWLHLLGCNGHSDLVSISSGTIRTPSTRPLSNRVQSCQAWEPYITVCYQWSKFHDFGGSVLNFQWGLGMLIQACRSGTYIEEAQWFHQ